MDDHWQVIEDALKDAYYRTWRQTSDDENKAASLARFKVSLAFVREQRTPPTAPLYSHRNGESVAPDLAGWYWVRVERLEDFSTKVRLEVWRRGFGRWLEFGNVNELGAVGEILSIYGPIPQPWDTPATLSADAQGKE